MIQSPRPWVAASSRPSGVTDRSAVMTFGIPVPTRDHVPPPSPETYTPTSVATTSRLPTTSTSLAGASTRWRARAGHVGPGRAAVGGPVDVPDAGVDRPHHPVARVARRGPLGCRSHGPDLLREGDRLPRRAARLARRESAAAGA